MNTRILVLLTASSLVLAPAGLVFAQTQAQTQGQTQAQTQAQTQGQTTQTEQNTIPVETFGRGFGRGHGFGHGFSGLPFGRLALGTTARLTFYDGDPAANGQSLQTLNFTYGEDSEAAFAEQFAAARAEASYVTAAVGEQSRTLELSTAATDTDTDNDGFRRGFGRGGLSLGGLNDGSTVTAVFYDGDPAANGQSLQTLSFTYGESSEAGFAADFAAAAETAAFVVVTTSPQTYTVPLTASSFGSGDFGGRGDRDGFGRGGFGRGDDGRGGSR